MDRQAILERDAEERLVREAEDRRFLYKDVEELIEVGFLTHTFVVRGAPVTFRSLIPPDYVRLAARTSHLKSPYDILRWSLASSVWFLNGFEVSADPKDNGPFHVYNTWAQDLPESLVEVLSSALANFNLRLQRALRLTEAFCYESYSRSLWRMQGRPTEGLRDQNVVRRLWAAHNLGEDDEELDQRLWGHTRAVVGSMSSKGAKYLIKQLEKIDEREKSRRQRSIESAVNWVLRGEEERKPLKVVVGGEEMEIPHIHSAQTTEDLEEEMRRVFSGDKDYHDHLVHEYQKSVKERVFRKREERSQAILEARRRSEEAEEEGLPPLVGYTQEQLARLKPEIAKKPKTTDSFGASASANYMFERYFGPEVRPGVLTPSLKVEDAGEQEHHKYGKIAEEPSPEGGGLQDQISRRRPTLKEKP